MQLDSPPTPRTPKRHLITVEGVVGEHILVTYAQKKMLCTLNAIGGAITVYSVSCNGINRARTISQSTPTNRIQLT